MTGGVFADVRDIESVISILQNAEVAIGERLHFLLFALKNNTPVAPISSDPKIDALSLELFGIEAIEISKKDRAEEIGEKIEKYIAGNDISERKSAINSFSDRIKRDMDIVAKICLSEKYNKGVEKRENICYNNP